MCSSIEFISVYTCLNGCLQVGSLMKYLPSGCIKVIIFLALALTLLGCADSNEHFCAKYSYYNDQLSVPGIMPLSDIKQQLIKDIEKHDRRKDRLMLIVLEDKIKGLLTDDVDALKFCNQMSRSQKLN